MHALSSLRMARWSRRIASQLWFQLLLAIALGVAAGLVVLDKRAAPCSEWLGALVDVRLARKALATPLVFCAVVDAVARTAIDGRMGLRLLGICFTNTTFAALLAVGLASGDRESPGATPIRTQSRPSAWRR